MSARSTRAGSPLATLLVGAVVSAAVVGVIALLVPSLPSLGVLGGDGVWYDAMARHPLRAVAVYPEAGRLAVPLLVAALPGSVPHGFLVVTIASLVLSGALVALIGREVGLSPVHRAAAAALVAGSYIGVVSTYDRYFVDAPLLACVALALLFALRRSRTGFLCAALLAVFVKEIGVTLVVLPYLLWRPPGRAFDRRALREALVLAVPVVCAFLLLELAAPHATVAHDLRRSALTPHHLLLRGFVVSVLNPIVALFGAVTLAWPLGFARSPGVLKRAHLWPAIAAPILAFGWWERTLGPLLPFVVPAALFALRRASWQRTTLFVAGSLWITAVVGSLTVGGTATTIAHKLALVSPGLLLAAATLVPEYLDVGRARLGTEPVPATGTPQAEIVSPRRGAGRAP